MLSRSIGSGTFEPRVIRPPGVSRGSCVDTPSPSSTARNRRPSTSNTLTPSQRPGSLTFPQLSSHQPAGPLPGVPFQRPAYLEHSSLKHLLNNPLNPVLRLPTRWSDQDRHLSLSVSPDGREVTFVGKLGFQSGVHW